MDKVFLESCLQKNMSTRDISKISNKSKSTVSYWINKYGLSDKSKFKKNEKFTFGEINSKEKAYILGFILADAYISDEMNVEICCQMNDKEIIEFISKIINSNVMYNNKLDKKNRIFPSVRTHKRIADIKKIIGGTKKENRHYPRINKEFEKYLLLGFFDGDGSITHGRRKYDNRIWQKISFTSQYKVLLGVQKYLINNLNIATAIHPKSGEKCFVLEFSSRENVLKFCEHIYSDENFIILKRKYLKYNALRLELEENGGTQ